jgi:hypothetical protein
MTHRIEQLFSHTTGHSSNNNNNNIHISCRGPEGCWGGTLAEHIPVSYLNSIGCCIFNSITFPHILLGAMGLHRPSQYHTTWGGGFTITMKNSPCQLHNLREMGGYAVGNSSAHVSRCPSMVQKSVTVGIEWVVVIVKFHPGSQDLISSPGCEEEGIKVNHPQQSESAAECLRDVRNKEISMKKFVYK